MIGIVPPPHLVIDRPHSADQVNNLYEKAGESKKRQRPKTADLKKNEGSDHKATPPSRYVLLHPDT